MKKSQLRKIIKKEILREAKRTDKDLYKAYEDLKVSLMGGAPGIYGDKVVEKAFEKLFKNNFKMSFNKLCEKFTGFSYELNDLDFD